MSVFDSQPVTKISENFTTLSIAFLRHKQNRTTIPYKIFGAKKRNPVKLDRTRNFDIWFSVLLTIIAKI